MVSTLMISSASFIGVLLSLSSEVPTCAHDEHPGGWNQSLRIVLWIKAMGLARTADSVHKVAFDLQVPELREVEPQREGFIVNVVPARTCDRRHRVYQLYPVMAIVASHLHPF